MMEKKFYDMYFRSNEMNSNEIINKFDGFYNGINIIKIRIINKIK